ncbi:MAG TPA: gliding motility lipoprotein GldH [Parasegetibacter sp.]
MQVSGKFSLQALFLSMFMITMAACTEIGVFEKNVTVPGHKWDSAFKPAIKFHVTDTAVFYNIYVVLRHTDAYPYNNLWIKLQQHVNDSLREEKNINLILGNNEQGWLGSGMSEIFEHRVRITPEGGIMLRPGTHEFVLEHIMRKDPLPEVMNVGIRVEKVL